MCVCVCVCVCMCVHVTKRWDPYLVWPVRLWRPLLLDGLQCPIFFGRWDTSCTVIPQHVGPPSHNPRPHIRIKRDRWEAAQNPGRGHLYTEDRGDSQFDSEKIDRPHEREYGVMSFPLWGGWHLMTDPEVSECHQPSGHPCVLIHPTNEFCTVLQMKMSYLPINSGKVPANVTVLHLQIIFLQSLWQDNKYKQGQSEKSHILNPVWFLSLH